MLHLVVGIDIGGTNTVLGLVDKSGNMYAEHKFRTPNNKDNIQPETYVNALHEGIQAMLGKVQNEFKLVGIGIGAPNANYYTGTIEYAVNLPWKNQSVPLAGILKLYYPDMPVCVTNDANAAAIGEMVYGGARGMKNFISITLGTGLGSGFVANGELIYGDDGFAGEFGHITVCPDGRECGCGRKGCLETYVSATGIKRTAFEVMSEMSASLLSPLKSLSYDQLDAKTLFDAAEQGDPIAIECFKRTGALLGSKLADAVAITSPEAIFIYGGLANSGDWIMGPTQKAFEENMLGCFCVRDAQGVYTKTPRTKLLLSGLNASNGAVLGAAALAWKEVNE